jgi:hypothetical protein
MEIKAGVLEFFGWIYVLVGVFFVLISFPGLMSGVGFTGLSILGNVGGDVKVSLGIVFFIAGIVLLVLKRHVDKREIVGFVGSNREGEEVEAHRYLLKQAVKSTEAGEVGEYGGNRDYAIRQNYVHFAKPGEGEYGRSDKSRKRRAIY